VFENRVLRGIFGPKRDEVIGDGWRLRYEGVSDLYCSCDQMENNKMSGDCSTYGREETCIQGFAGETWGKKTSWKT
jgi:hypothetical protein